VTRTGRPGRPARLTRERIIDTVVDLLERDGVGAITTRSVGEALDVHPTALYRHFRDMDEVLREAADQVLAGLVAAEGPVAAIGAEAAWAEVVDLCRRLRATLMTHPGAAQVMAPGPSRMPNERAFTERMLGLLCDAGLPDEQVTLAYHALVEYVVGSAAIDARDGEEERHRLWRNDYRGADPSLFPVTTRLADRMYPSQEGQFEFGLRLMARGLRDPLRSPARR